MRLLPSRLLVLLGLALALAAFGIGVAPGCGSVANIECPGIYDENRIGPDGNPDPCCARTLPCPKPGAGDAGKDADAAADADGGPPCTGMTCMDAGSDAADDGGQDAGDGGPACEGACVPLAPLSWQGPALVWVGPVGAAPGCPDDAPVQGLASGYHGLDGLDAGPASCGACSCAGADGGCALPEHMTASNTGCDGGGAPVPVQLPFDPPPAWDGGCSSFDKIQPAPCPGPGCIRSVTSDPLTLTESCAPETAPASPTPPAGFSTDAVACLGVTYPTCGDPGLTCAPIGASFRTCIFQLGQGEACPDSYPMPLLVAEGLDDKRACTPCACAPAAGGNCRATLSVDVDAVCSFSQFTTNLGTTSQCFDLAQPAAPLGSKSLTKMQYTPGTCSPSGGESTDGGVVATGVATFCCLP